MTRTLIRAAVALLAAGAAVAQPTLDSLWPADDGTRWEYTFHVFDHDGDIDFTSPAFLQLSGTAMTPGGEAQVLLEGHDEVPESRDAAPRGLSSLLARVWRARPELREALAELPARQANWWPHLLHGGYFMKGAENIQMWQDIWLHPTWIYLEDDISEGATFTLQLLPEITDDIFMHGTVGEIGATVAIPAGTFVDAVRMDYLVDFGVGIIMNDEGEKIGTMHAETVGHVHYVPGVGPVEMLEEWMPFVWIDCDHADCPPEWLDLEGDVVETDTLALTRGPVAHESASWGGVKSLYR